jgi:hypothetical protein
VILNKSVHKIQDIERYLLRRDGVNTITNSPIHETTFEASIKPVPGDQLNHRTGQEIFYPMTAPARQRYSPAFRTSVIEPSLERYFWFGVEDIVIEETVVTGKRRKYPLREATDLHLIRTRLIQS